MGGGFLDFNIDKAFVLELSRDVVSVGRGWGQLDIQTSWWPLNHVVAIPVPHRHITTATMDLRLKPAVCWIIPLRGFVYMMVSVNRGESAIWARYVGVRNSSSPELTASKNTKGRHREGHL